MKESETFRNERKRKSEKWKGEKQSKKWKKVKDWEMKKPVKYDGDICAYNC